MGGIKRERVYLCMREREGRRKGGGREKERGQTDKRDGGGGGKREYATGTCSLKEQK